MHCRFSIRCVAGMLLLLALLAGQSHAQDGLRVFVKVRPELRAVTGAQGQRFPAGDIQDIMVRYSVAAPVALLDARGAAFAKTSGEEHPLENVYLLVPARPQDATAMATELAALPGVV
ncbi:MAG: hypothetical protein KFF77_07865, partial [Bacteroidetes bacterium]|nr:hypothetical protein [Bacteroidota bacterium]